MEDAGISVGGDAYGGVTLPRSARKSPRRRRRNLILSGALSCVVLAGTGAVWATSTYGLGGFEAVEAGASGIQSDGALNILLVGVDKRDNLSRREQRDLRLGREVGQRTDTMMLIHLSADHRRIAVVSLPRDSWTTIPGKGHHKINSAYQLGGPSLTLKTVQQATGLPINLYVEVNVLGFIDVVDSLKGGVTVCTPVPINDKKINFNLAAGTHQLDGIQALFYARTRATVRSDFDRIDRQQQVMSALLDKVLSPATLTDPAALGKFIKSVQASVKIDPQKDLNSLVTQLRDTSLDDVRFASIPIADPDYRTPTGESAVKWDQAGAKDLFRRIAADEDLGRPSPSPSASAPATPTASPSPLTVPPARITMRVLNGTDIQGLGARTRDALLASGFVIPETAGNTPKKDFTRTVIRYGPGREDSARTVAAALPGAELKLTDKPGIEVVLGSDQPKVRKVKANAVVTPSPSASASAAPTAAPVTRTATQNICKN
ncbi:LCP family protein [Nonomuraea sp. NPDC050310]|uniref:LCP family protein n=1 Tax=Nonomuraea sp. NPDC050310 TaxID=3154935 RepID=UPI0033F6BF61